MDPAFRPVLAVGKLTHQHTAYKLSAAGIYAYRTPVGRTTQTEDICPCQNVGLHATVVGLVQPGPAQCVGRASAPATLIEELFMHRRIAHLAVIPVAFALVLGVTGTATAVTESVGGGTWYHGILKSVYSTYDNDIRTHRASVRTTAQSINSGWQKPGTRAKASAQASLTGNKANYDFIK